MWSRIGWVLAAVLASFVLTGAGQARTSSDGPEHPGAARAVAVLTGIEEGEAQASVPADFAEVMGYVPEPLTGPDGSVRLTAADGDCSTPFGGTTYGFDRVCKTHDYGYDLLRYAAAEGGELGPWARIAIDDMFGEEMHRHCETVDGGEPCQVLAGTGESLVKVNSWRQGQGVPELESSGPYIASAALLVAAVMAPPIVRRVARRDRRASARPVPGDTVVATADGEKVDTGTVR
ncbi:hypothetical protein [Phytoactinopolyspora endophytica]|uniref:hypothetical protein n=1 Tax=Phytoactinopolyspora endophytica TaxID=1642495 RepID=UPI00101B5B7D|nr:hypothetical protein [Phytoactinopolyspora endophytica]